MISSVISSCKLSCGEPSFTSTTAATQNQSKIDYNSTSTHDENDNEWTKSLASDVINNKNRIRTSSCSSNQETNQNKNDKTIVDHNNDESSLNERVEM